MNSGHQNEGSERGSRTISIGARCRARFFGCLAGWIALGLLFSGNAAAQQPPDTIYYNGNIVSVWADHPSVEAVAIAGDRFSAVGSDADVLKTAGPQTKKIDLHG